MKITSLPFVVTFIAASTTEAFTVAPTAAARVGPASRLRFASVGTSRGRRDVLLSAVVTSSTAATATTTAPVQVKDEEEALLVPSVVVVEQEPRLDWSAVQSVLTTGLLVTANTIGAGALALPDLVAKPGLAISTGMFVSAYCVNLLSGLILAEVAIKQHEAHSDDAPSSFRQVAEMSLESPTIANGIASVSLFVNTCALTYSLGRAGSILSDLTLGAVDHFALSATFAALLAIMGATQSRVRISQISSLFVTALFCSLAGLLLPGLPHVADPMGTFLAPGTSSNVVAGMGQVGPIMLTTLIFQNIVPPVTKIMDYDRTKSVAALVIGSFLPLAMYLAWSFAVLGGGVDTNVGLESPLMTLFSVAAVTGSSIGCTMAISEELQAFMGDATANSEPETIKGTAVAETAVVSAATEDEDNGYAWPAVLAAVLVPLGCSALCNDYTDALKLSGGYGIPVLYGAIPVAMAWTQRKNLQAHANLVPGGVASLGLVGVAFGAFMMNSIVGDVSHAISSV